MKPPRPASLRAQFLWLAGLLAAHLAIALACVSYLSFHFYLSRRVVFLHIGIISTVLILMVSGLSLALARKWIANTPVTRLVISGLAALTASLLAMLYALDVFSNHYWERNVSYDLVRRYLSFSLPNRAPFFVSGWVHAELAGAALGLFLIYWSSSNAFLSALGEFGRRFTFDGATRRRWLTVLLIGAVYVGGLAIVARQLHESKLLSREPIVGLFLAADNELDFASDAEARRITQADQQARLAYPHQQTFDRKNVILIVIDSLRPDHMSVYGYARATTPFLDEQRKAGRLKAVDFAVSTCAETTCGVLSALSSKSFHHLVTNNFSLPNLLHDQGYNVYQILSGGHTWNGLRQAYGHEQTLYFDGTDSMRYSLNDDRALFEGLEKVPSFSGTPAFFQFHLMSVHTIGIKHDAYRRFEPSTFRRDFKWVLQGDDREVLINSYDNGVLEADDTIRNLFNELQKKGYLSNSVAVIAGDHGEGLGERNRLGHLGDLHQSFIRIPLLFYDETAQRYPSLPFGTLIDVAPTLLDRLGLPMPPSWEGHSLLQPASLRYTFHQTKKINPCYAVIKWTPEDTVKYMRCNSAQGEALFDLRADHEEDHNLVAEPAAPLLRDLRTRLDAYTTGAPPQER